MRAPARVRQQASEVASMDISKIELSGSIDKLRESGLVADIMGA